LFFEKNDLYILCDDMNEQLCCEVRADACLSYQAAIAEELFYESCERAPAFLCIIWPIAALLPIAWLCCATNL